MLKRHWILSRDEMRFLVVKQCFAQLLNIVFCTRRFVERRSHTSSAEKAGFPLASVPFTTEFMIPVGRVFEFASDFDIPVDVTIGVVVIRSINLFRVESRET
jgi:hypothetical protein